MVIKYVVDNLEVVNIYFWNRHRHIGYHILEIRIEGWRLSVFFENLFELLFWQKLVCFWEDLIDEFCVNIENQSETFVGLSILHLG